MKTVYLGLQGDRLVTLKEDERVVTVKRLVGIKAKDRKTLWRLLTWHPRSRLSRGGVEFWPAYCHHGRPVDATVAAANLPKWLLTAMSAPTPNGEDRPKDTDDVSESSDDPSEDAEQHGGDGNSGEVDAQAETSSDEERDAQPTDLSQAGEEDPAEKSEEDRRREALKEQYAPKEPEDDEVFQNNGTSPVVRTEVVEPPTAAGEALKKVLKRLFEGWSSTPSEETGGQASSPRINGSALVREMSTRRWNMSRIFRQEMEEQPRMILVAADVSASCSASSGHTVGICQALTKVWPQLLFVTHANGRIMSITRNGIVLGETDVLHYDAEYPSWEQLIKDHRVLGVLLFGDADGLYELQPIWQAHACPTIWLDSYCASYGKVRKDDYRRVYGVTGEAPGDENVDFYIGVNNEESAACALRQALRNKKSA